MDNFPEKAFIDNTIACQGAHGVPPVICVKRGEEGYYPIYTRLTAAELNEPLGVTKEVAEAMHVCSMSGWDIRNKESS